VAAIRYLIVVEIPRYLDCSPGIIKKMEEELHTNFYRNWVGQGFNYDSGIRDIQYIFKDQEMAKNAKTKMNAICKKYNKLTKIKLAKIQ
jgi:hypothetical protein